MSVLRGDLLKDIRVVLAGSPPVTIRERLQELGATLGGESAAEPPQMLVFDARPAFGGGGTERLRRSLEAAWSSIHAVANAALIPSAEPTKIVIVAPAANAGALAAAARAGLENLARTLSVEWARYEITTTAILPGAQTSDAQLAELVSYLASPAGNYFNGCRFELGGL